MKIFAVNGSPRKDKGNTDRILQPFLAGAREAGAETDLVYLQEKKIKPCLGCLTCWLKTPGVCVQKDDMAELLEMRKAADLIVFATPLYVYGMTAQLKAFLDRSVPAAEPFVIMRDGRCSHPAREGVRTRGFVLVSSCGFQELHNFDELVMSFQVLAKVTGLKFFGSLLRPHAEVLPVFERLAPDKVKPVYESARRAGKQLVEEGLINQEHPDGVAKELVPLEGFCDAANAYFKSVMKKNGLEGG